MENHIKLSELKPGMGNIFIKDLKVVKVGDINEYEIHGKKMKVCEVEIIDDSVTEPIRITAWDFACQFLRDSEGKEAKIIELQKCFCKEYGGKIQLSTGKFGKIFRIN
jgi:hypothetical protein